MPRIKLTLAYEGTRFSGWQIQAFRTGKQPLTIQGELERALSEILKEYTPVHGAGRTDAGVHAEAQVCHFDVPQRYAHVHWVRALNTRLSPDIRILAAEEAVPDFHARIRARRKEYAYALWMGESKAIPRIQAFVWSTPPLNLAAMEAAAAHLVGRHDFASFRNAGIPRRAPGDRRADGIDNTVRTIFSITPRLGSAGPLRCPPEWPVMTWHVEGDGFLRQMVRNIMGLLVWIGQEKIAPETVPTLLASCRRESVPSPCAPAQGLTLMRVFY